MLQRLSSFILVFIFLLTSSGFAFSIHSCRGKISDISFSIKEKKCCCEKMGLQNSCCENETQLVKIQDDYINTSYSNIATPLSLQLSSFLYSFSIEDQNINSLIFSSPPPRKVRLGILIQTFRI